MVNIIGQRERIFSFADQFHYSKKKKVSKLSLVNKALALCRTPVHGAINSGSTGRKLYTALYEAFSFQNKFLRNRDSKYKFEENNFYLSHNFLSNGCSFIFLA